MPTTISVRAWTVASVIILGLLYWATVIPIANAAEPISIGAMGPESTLPGKGIFNGARLAVDEINAHGGVDGRPIKLHLYDTHLSSTNATRAFERAVQQDHVVAMTGIFTSEVALTELPWAARLKTPLLITGAASNAITARIHAHPDRLKYDFLAMNNSILTAKQVCIFTRDTLSKSQHLHGFDRVAILAENADWTKPLIAAYKRCLPKDGMKIVDTIVFAPDTVDFSPIFSRIKRDHANVIMAGLAHAAIKPVVQWHRQQVPDLMSGINSPATSSKFWDATGGAAQDVITWSQAADGVPMTDKTAAFYDAYRKRFHVKQPAYSAYTTYEAVHAIAGALRRDGGKRGGVLVKALEKTDFVGVVGRVRFYGLNSEYAHEFFYNQDPKKGQSFLGIQWQNGHQVVIWPKRLATGEMKVPSFVPIPQ